MDPKRAPSGAASVVSLGAREAREIMDIRELIDGLAARLFAERGIPPALDRQLPHRQRGLSRQVARAHVRAAAAHWIVPDTDPETEG